MTYRYAPPFGLRVLQLVILAEAMTRGLALILSKEQVLATTDITNAAPMQVWGVIFISFSLLGFFGEALMSGINSVDSPAGSDSRAWPSFIAHAGLMILYLTLCLAYGNAVLDGELSLASAPAAMVVIAYIHWLFARRRKSHVA
ncbi:minor tail protein [Mycobacterium phage Phaded]|uniref:Membrane protein n=1 Tax=Mycobacterium phage Phaded TaxID=2686088 RepID=A0A6B9J988_9CAUD|nr:minor tail protein [Mycobacterium phage Phaded]APC43181.1 minor tail protein [Mycobacterium phage Jaan]QGZ16834.1 membrane protein [Mycobacterium phage Phaded]